MTHILGDFHFCTFQMEVERKISTARRIFHEIGQLGSPDRHRPGFGSGASAEYDESNVDEQRFSQGGALPVSPPNSLAGKLLKIVVAEDSAKADLAIRLVEIKSNLHDLSERQLNDLLDEAPSEQKDIEDVDKLLSEMRTVRRCMETVVALERALYGV